VAENGATVEPLEQYTVVDGVRTRYLSRGSGQPVVFFHGGWTGNARDVRSAWDWEPLFAHFPQSLQAVAVDLLGQGHTASGKVDEYTFRAVIQHARAFLGCLEKGPFHLVGHGVGGLLATRLAIDDPNAVKSLTIVSSATICPGVGRNQIVLDAAPRPLLSRESLRWVLERYCFSSRTVTERWLDQVVSIAESDSNRTAVNAMQAQGWEKRSYQPDLARAVSQTHRFLLEDGVMCPTFIIWGLQDPTADVDNARLMIEMFQHMQEATEVRYINNAGHFPFRDQPAVFGRALSYFINGVK
jgi:2-hydroxy-6-oxonona-2,4-dienedioate hydrolase